VRWCAAVPSWDVVDAVVSAHPSLRAAVAADFRGSGWRRRLALCGVVLWLAYEWGIGNETVTPWLLARVIAERDGIGAIPAAALVGFTFTTVQQLLAGLTALAGFSMFDRTASAAWSRLESRFGEVPGEWSNLRLTGRAVLVFGLGTTAVALLQIMATGRADMRHHRRAIVEAALLCGTIVGVLGGAAGALAYSGRRIDAIDGATEWVLRVLGNPLFWLGILVVVALVHLARRDHGRRPGGGVPVATNSTPINR
jgi:hypothetical protein